MNKSFIGKKLLSLMLSVLMCLSLIPSVAFATIAEGETGSEATKGSSSNPYTLEEFGAMTRENYIAAQNSLGGTMYVNVGEYSYDTNGVLGNGVRVDSATGADKTDLNCYAANGYKGDGNDGANGKTVVFTGTSISNSVNGYTDIDKIGTSLLLAVPAYTTVKFEKIKFNGVFSFDYQLYTSPWSQLQRIEFNDCEFNGLIVGGIAATELAFVGCTFNEFKNTVSANNSNPTWIRPAYGNWTKGDNEGQGEDFKSLTKITFTNNTVTSTRPVKFERISQWDITSTVTVDGNYFDITNTDNSNKNVGMYLGFNAAANLVMGNNQKSENTAALYTVAYNKGSALPDGSTVKDLNGNDVVITDAVEWKTTNPITIKTPTDNFVAKIGDSIYATLKEAFDAVTDDTATTIKLLANCSGDGIQVKGGKNITVDFDGHTYTVDGETVGSAGTETNGFQLLAKSNITFKNGSIVSSKARILIQSYSNLTIENMTLDLSEQPLYGYTLSNNNGVTVINNSTIKAPLAKRSMAFDACGFANYGDTTVTLKGNSVIEGDVVFSNESTVNSNVTLNLEGGTIKGELSPGTGAEKVTVKKSEAVSVPAPSGYKWTTVDGVQTLVKLSYVAEVNGVKYETLQAAIDAAGKSQTVTLVSDTRENVTIAKPLTLDLNGYTLNGGTVKGKPALTVTAKGVTVKDSGTARTGTIMREDTAENSGISSYYVIDVQGVGWLTFEGGTVKNNSGIVGVKGASLVRIGDDSVAKYPGLNIKGGTFTQDNFIAIKVDRGDLFLNGGTINSANSYAIENWFRATVKGGTVNGDAASWTYSGGANSTLEIIGGTINGNVTSVNYGNAENKKATVKITGGTVNGKLDTRSYDPTTGELTAIDDAKKAAIEVTGGTFTNDPTAYLVESSSITVENGKYSVAKAYLAKVGNTQYYTMDEAFKAQTASGEEIVLLRDYKTAGTFSSGSIKRTVDLNGHTWTYTGTGINYAAFEINYSDATLTVKNGKVISNTLVGLIPSAMGGTIKYDNSTLIFENVEMISNGHSGIETNGNNTNDTVTLKNSTLNVPNGYGIYFPSSGALNIENSKITAKTMGVQVCSGSLNISGDSVINVTGDPVEKTENDGAIQDGAAVSVVNRPGYKGLGNVTITGGTFKSAKGEALKAYTWENKTESKFGKSNVISVSGGTFSSAVPADYCAAGYAPKANTDGTYGVEPKVTTEKRNLSVDINGAGKVEYSINGSDSGIWSNSITKVPYEIGTQFTVKAVPRAGSTFLYWVNSEGRVISDAPTYSFYLGDNLTIKAVFCYSEDSAYVTFRDMGNTILMAISADSDGYVNVPTNLIAYAGYTFIGWYDADGKEYIVTDGKIQVSGNAAITIYAKYKADTETVYTVTVDGIEKGKYTYGSYVTVTAEDIEGKEFAGWYINGTLVSYDKAYSFYVTGNVALEARYSNTVVVKEPVITLLVSERKETGNGSQYIIFTAAWSADSSYTFVEAGIILAKDNSKELTLENVDNSTILKKATRLTTVEGTYAHTFTLSSDTAKANAVYARAYFTFIKDGKVVTIYTTVQISKPI